MSKCKKCGLKKWFLSRECLKKCARIYKLSITDYLLCQASCICEEK